MEFSPANQCSVSGIEKGIFTCYEIKSCKEDVYSGNGLNFFGEKNYIVTTMACYKDITTDGDTCGFDIEVIDLDSAEHIYLNYYFQFSTIVAASGE